MTIPNKPRSRKQKYRLTEKGLFVSRLNGHTIYNALPYVETHLNPVKSSEIHLSLVQIRDTWKFRLSSDLNYTTIMGNIINTNKNTRLFNALTH